MILYGYREVMGYVRDRIDEKYSLMRPDAYAYPLLSGPTYAGGLAANDVKFTYWVKATVPLGYRTACGGELLSATTSVDSASFTFRSIIPTWRIDIAVAKFADKSNAKEKIIVYYIPEDSTGADNVMDAAIKATAFYSELFGKPRINKGYTVIEIPDGWGSQASDYYFLQSAAAFKDSTRISEVYHEIAHTWNACAAETIKRCRYFDEAFASYFEALALRAFRGEKVFQEDMENSRASFAAWAGYDSAVFVTPIASYGTREFGRHSYTKGAWSLYILNQITGDKTFASIIRNMISEFDNQSITFEQFQNLCERTSGKNLSRFFNEWIYGYESSRFLADKIPVKEIVNRY